MIRLGITWRWKQQPKEFTQEGKEMWKLRFVLALVMVIGLMFGATVSFAQHPMSGCGTGSCGSVRSMGNGSMVMNGNTMMRPHIFIPKTVMQPYEYQGTVIQQRDYRTPVRDMIFGRAVQKDVYAPSQQASTASVAPSVNVSVANLPSGTVRPVTGNVVVIQQVIR